MGTSALRSEKGRDALTLGAPAKINVTLEVVGRLANGYHAIRSVMLKLPRLADEISVQVQEGGSGILIRCDSAEVPLDATNLCHRAASSYLGRAGLNARVAIDIRKAIPVAAGLGGGSSDAAAVLLALDRRFDGALARPDLVALGGAIGKDVPFFLDAATIACASGMGETVHAIAATPSFDVLIVNPRIAVSTPDAYDALRRELWFMDRPERVDRAAIMASALVAGDANAIAASLYNDFETVSERAHPVLKEIKQALLAFGAQGALMSGSGPTVFGLFRTETTLARARHALETRYPSFLIERG